MQPETKYAITNGRHIAYQVVGEGPFDLVFVPNWVTNIDVMWDLPPCARYLRRLASFSRLILFDKRGSGVSDPVSLAEPPSLEQWMDDIRVVLDAAGSSRAALLGDTDGGQMALLFTATYPERTSALVLVNASARVARGDDYRIGLPRKLLDQILENLSRTWGTGDILDLSGPELAKDPGLKAAFGRYQRLAMPPGTVQATYGGILESDVRSVLPAIRVPTLVIHREGNLMLRPDHGRYLAEKIDGARYVELPGSDFFPWYAGDFDSVLDEVQEFLTGSRAEPEADRVLATVLFTDLVSSTERAAELGDRRWRGILDEHDRISRTHIERFRGRMIKTTGDGVLATFDGPARAIRCARAIGDEVRGLGVEVRSGLHTGEVEIRGEDVGGIAVNLAARVMTEAGPGEVIVSSTVKDLVVGSGIEFDDRGTHELKGVPGEWRLYFVRS